MYVYEARGTGGGQLSGFHGRIHLTGTMHIVGGMDEVYREVEALLAELRDGSNRQNSLLEELAAEPTATASSRPLGKGFSRLYSGSREVLVPSHSTRHEPL
ncbi:hypothetical protein HPB50_006051 [Hyalomma asiaticum]|uniref:Uncharacterized protein n=1 Tax=Hyalomma asiaticum TaxID=266040 RepID=A0ACB7SD03_HYAAI|nr:hypothetical protein HPB50_006051 [Hyalomma asiaticum]